MPTNYTAAKLNNERTNGNDGMSTSQAACNTYWILAEVVDDSIAMIVLTSEAQQKAEMDAIGHSHDIEWSGITAAEVVACCDDLAVGFADLSGNNGTEAEVQYLAAQLERSGRSVFAETVNV